MPCKDATSTVSQKCCIVIKVPGFGSTQHRAECSWQHFFGPSQSVSFSQAFGFRHLEICFGQVPGFSVKRKRLTMNIPYRNEETVVSHTHLIWAWVLGEGVIWVSKDLWQEEEFSLALTVSLTRESCRTALPLTYLRLLCSDTHLLFSLSHFEEAVN